MIHHNSTDPVLIKKISLKIWSLRDEIEAHIQEKIKEDTPLSEKEILQIRSLYTKRSSSDNVLELKPNTELDTDESEMMRAMSEDGAGENTEQSSQDNVTPISSNISPTVDPNIISINLDAPVLAADKIAKGKTVLSEISMEKMFFFCNKSFTEGQSIVIQFCIPKSFIINADIRYCRPFNLKSRIISENHYTHRAMIQFNFLREGERALLRQFLRSIEPDLTQIKTNNDKNKNDELSELDEFAGL